MGSNAGKTFTGRPSKAFQWLTLAGMGLSLVLSGCGFGVQSGALSPTTGQPVKAAQTQRVFPTEPGFVWQYDVVAHPAADPYVDYHGTETVRLISARQQNGAQVLECQAMDTFTTRYRFPKLVLTGNKVVLQGVTFWGSLASEAPELTIGFLDLPLKAGARWDDGEWSGEVKGRERVTVPTGTYDAWKVSVIGTHDRVYTAVGTYWVAPGVGIVKSDLSVPGWNLESKLIVASVQR